VSAASANGVKKAYDRVSLMIDCPFEYHARWVKKGERYVCQWRFRPLERGRWSAWKEV
jgi:hypothetical protein